eukprot:8014740-Alexandrium_andersonii.AAC.1
MSGLPSAEIMVPRYGAEAALSRMSPSGKATKRSDPMESNFVLERLMVSPKGAATSRTAARASSARGADRATTA